MKYTCEYCDEEFDNAKIKANHIRWKHKKPSKDNLIKARHKRMINEQGVVTDYEVICNNCGVKFNVKEPSKKFPIKEKYFCSRSCANTREHSKETKDKISKSIIYKLNNDLEYREKCIQNLRGPNNSRCSSKGEREIRKYLKKIYGEHNVKSHRIITFNKIDSKSVDITFSDRKLFIEYDGIWHRSKELYEKLGTPEKYEKVVHLDKLLDEYCLDNNIKLIRIIEEEYKSNKKKYLKELLDNINT